MNQCPDGTASRQRELRRLTSVPVVRPFPRRRRLPSSSPCHVRPGGVRSAYVDEAKSRVVRRRDPAAAPSSPGQRRRRRRRVWIVPSSSRCRRCCRCDVVATWKTYHRRATVDDDQQVVA